MLSVKLIIKKEGEQMKKKTAFLLNILLCFAVSATALAKKNNWLERQERAIRALYNKNADKVVFIYTTNQKKEALGSASGSILRRGGYILTANHVVSDKLDKPEKKIDKIYVRFREKGKVAVKEAKIIAVDPQTDVAIIKINHIFKTKIVTRITRMRPAEFIFHIGYPMQKVAEKHERIIPAMTYGSFFRYFPIIMMMPDRTVIIETIQLGDLRIAPGSSGAPLFDKNGLVFGMITVVIAKGHIFTGAIPIRHALTLLRKITKPAQ